MSRLVLLGRYPWQWLSRLVLLAVIAWCVAYALWDAHDRAVWRERGVETTGVVTEVSTGEGGFVRLDVDGTSRTILPCPDPPPRTGARVEVVRDSANPSEVRLLQQFDRVTGRALLLVAAGATVFAALLELLWLQERRDGRRTT
ncbi:hypothetical protein [Kineococcus rhizosphaerae]|uniref:Uncharacterized protein n=1 Tax=Kineococcus rhizosphaerae TaxID=559628 RepID=A0A2T0QZT5_9ACTN|nr:hypothetical protein [Kineococcus rhizosphaerae]PRY12192.1 hypothetical protein CLV37_111149 [Kineococcus rhizosphaerae]